MKTTQPNRYIASGVLLLSITLILKNTIELPELFCGIGLGAAIGLELLGFLYGCGALKRFREFKLRLLKGPSDNTNL